MRVLRHDAAEFPFFCRTLAGATLDHARASCGGVKAAFAALWTKVVLRPMRLALFEPDIPQNAGTLIRLGAGLNVPVDIIEPCGFLFSDRGFKRAGMDYLDAADYVRHSSWQAYLASRAPGRLILLTVRGSLPYTDFAFAASDTLLLGRESAGVPDTVHEAVDARLRIPLRTGMRSINVAQAGAMVLGEALRQTKGWP